jgi:5-methylcytosine-specific restriction protein A
MSKRICPMHGLWDKTEKQPRCPKCKTIRDKSYDKNERNQESNKFYHSSSWKKLRTIVLNNNPFCVECGSPADTVDHIVSIKSGGAKLDSNNLQSMCKSCHNKKENQEGNRWNK